MAEPDSNSAMEHGQASNPLSQIHFIEDTDITRFAYELHVLAGDFLRECEYNMRAFTVTPASDYIAIMGRDHMWIHDALDVYRSTADMHQMIFTTEFLGARAFLFHADRSEDSRLHGSVMMMDLDTLRSDVKSHACHPIGVAVEGKDGKEEVIGLEKWHAMEPYEKLSLKSWGFRYDPETMDNIRRHYAGVSDRWKSQAFHVSDEYLEERLNTEYMMDAQNPDMDKYRIPLSTAKQMLLYNEAPVYRLLPSGPEKIAPITVVTTGLWYEHYREFAIRPEDLGALDRLCSRETDRLLGRIPKEIQPEKRPPAPER